jgi:solute carrier family 15 (oligopeptide transporter), member 1
VTLIKKLAIVADSWWGKFHTILWLSIVYVMGSITMAVSAVEPIIELQGARTLTILGLFLIALGSGGIKPCVAAFGGEQFKMPEQARQLATFFSIFYFSINAGSLLSTTITPILREDVQCFGLDDCFSLAFGVPALLMIVAVLFFIFGKFLYKILPNQGNMLVKVSRCMTVSFFEFNFTRFYFTNPTLTERN